MSVEQVGTSGPVWGTTDETWGYMQTFEDTIAADEELLKNGQGDIVAAAYHGKKGEVSFEAVLLVPASAPDIDNIGNAFDLVTSTRTFYPSSITVVESNAAFQTLRGTGSWFPEFASPATTTTTTTTTA